MIHVNKEELHVHKLDMKQIGSVAKENNIAIYELTKVQPSLEELFMELTAGKAEYVSRVESMKRKGDRK